MAEGVGYGKVCSRTALSCIWISSENAYMFNKPAVNRHRTSFLPVSIIGSSACGFQSRGMPSLLSR
jgi:hypothetical protein